VEGVSGAAEVSGPEAADKGAELGSPEEGSGGGWRSGGGGGEVRGALGTNMPGVMPRDEGGGGIREVGPAAPAGRGTTLTGRGTMLAGAGGATEMFGSDAAVVLGSLSSPIEISRKARARRL
jgi:hypothetical protein